MPIDDQRIAAYMARQQLLIADHGCAISYVFDPEGDHASFGFTIGLTEHGAGHPEFLIAGLNPHITGGLLNDIAARVLTGGERFDHGQIISDLLVGYPVVIVTGPETDTLYPGALHGRYGDGVFTVQQIVWPDMAGRFPWDDGYDYPDTVQPTLGRP